jgi:BirA family transcriptional regulator, biotin operon repressor / biotin---[acetyl-CoA-carboxylase] ligase
MRLDPAATARGFRLAAHATLPSTNAQALTYAQNHRGEAGPLWITARSQTAGRGRRGSRWDSPSGNLYATLLLIEPAAAHRAPELSFVAALAVHDAVLACAPGLRQRLALKWPNDVLCGGGKLAGVLIEALKLQFGLAVAIGVGVNCKRHPAQTAYPATDLAEAGVDVAADDLFVALSGAMLQRLDQWRGGEGFSAIRSDWLDRGVGIGGDMQVRLPDRQLFGRCEALDEHGRLLLRLADGGLETIAAGDVFPLGAAQPCGSLRHDTYRHGAE